MEEFIKNGTWKYKLSPEFEKPYFKSLAKYIEKERSLFKVYPKPNETFNALI
jgi:uracil-DNA glycosylase